MLLIGYFEYGCILQYNYNYLCVSGTSPHTYDQQQVRPGENQVRIRGRCPGQTDGGEVEVLRIGML